MVHSNSFVAYRIISLTHLTLSKLDQLQQLLSVDLVNSWHRS